MCTLTYIPIGSENFFFTNNRDENPAREAMFPQEYCIDKSLAIFPKDKVAHGTWMMCHENDFSLCLLNGAFKKHKQEIFYRKSRGVMVLEFAAFVSSKNFIQNYIFDGMEPFTLLVLSYKHSRSLEEIRWDGAAIHYRKLDSSKLFIWSSATLYACDAQKLRQQWFDTWIGRKTNFSAEEVIRFHKTTGSGDSFNGLMMNRGEKVKTLSVTQIRRRNNKVSMHYIDLKENKEMLIDLTKKSLD
ncbi:hypothetical protein BZG02_13150 [Labilibaculum filiforme]|uniref:NRDE family protein n=1 Tax=Labilibaculum filiforme TaxID=1940526 RepID=A0A2N3HW47_9BACT|nr:hypothetical protein [Labilibaculum filiforme]PKQ62258.1 hypothetical protein BZG02_13150 [Labilibaculum filiforme]